MEVVVRAPSGTDRVKDLYQEPSIVYGAKLGFELPTFRLIAQSSTHFATLLCYENLDHSL